MADLTTDDEKIKEISWLQLDRMLAHARRYANEAERTEGPERQKEPVYGEHLA